MHSILAVYIAEQIYVAMVTTDNSPNGIQEVRTPPNNALPVVEMLSAYWSQSAAVLVRGT